MKSNISNKIYIAKNINSKSLDEIARYLKCGKTEVKNVFEKMKSNGEYDKYRNMPYQEAVEIAEKQSTPNSQNSLLDLNDILFKQLEKINDENLTEDEFKKEAETSKIVVNISQTIINNSKLLLEANKHMKKEMNNSSNVAIVLGIEDK